MGGLVGQVDAAEPAAPLLSGLAAGVLDEDAAHGLGRGGEEVAAAVPAAVGVAADQPQVGLVDQGGGLERLPGLLLRQPPGGQPAELVVDQRQQALGGLGVALLHGREGWVTSVIGCSSAGVPPSTSLRTWAPWPGHVQSAGAVGILA